jgi:hypothetical protein
LISMFLMVGSNNFLVGVLEFLGCVVIPA